MGSTTSYPARQLRRRRKEWLHRNGVIVALLVVAFVGLGAIMSVFIRMIPAPTELYLLGALHASLIAILVYLLNSIFLATDREAIWQMRGAWGEDNTRSELRRAKRKGLVWGWVDSVQLQVGDVDHIVVTRRAGIVVVDSKWRNQVGRDDLPAMAASARKAALRAEGVLRTVLKREPGARHRARVKPVTVTAVIVLWGAARSDVPSEAIVDGVRFIDGCEFVGWLAGLDGHPVAQEEARHALTLLGEFRSTVATATR